MQKKKHQGTVQLSIAFLLTGLVFVADILTPLGYAEWTLYVVPIALCLSARHPSTPIIAATAATGLILIGYLLSPVGAQTQMSLVNRLLGVVAFWVVAAAGARFITARREVERLTWLEQGKASLTHQLAGVQTPEPLAENVLAALAEYSGCVAGAFYQVQGDRLVRLATWAADGSPATIALGAGLAGQAAIDGRAHFVGPIDDTYVTMSSSLGGMKPRSIAVVPTQSDGVVNGVLEVAYLKPPEELPLTEALLRSCAETIGVALNAALSRIRLQELLAETQRQSEELQTQQEELRVSNEELEEQGRALRESKEQLEEQQAELEQSNLQLEEYSNHLERQKHELLLTQGRLEENARLLERTNQYKSEFLANMSHELRTPLNSSLILSRLLADNADGSLNEVQVRYARTIHASNQDLLELINDILDLAKIEAGKVEVSIEPVRLSHLLEPLRLTFEPIAQDAKVGFRLEVDEDLPETIRTDMLRVQQVLRNLLSNAFKFTKAGEVALLVSRAGERVRFAVRDTGIGIPEAQQEVIFEAFRQADGSTSRQFGGTGLGLSISRELARLLGGSIEVRSAPGHGSTFTLELPFEASAVAPVEDEGVAADQGSPTAERSATARPLPGFSPELKAAMDSLADSVAATERQEDAARSAANAAGSGTADAPAGAPERGRSILVIEDDAAFADVVKDLAAALDFDCVVTDNALDGLAIARERLPQGILLDIGLPDQSGLAVLEQLKRDPRTRPIPVHVVSASDHTQAALELGAIGYIVKPAMPEQLTAALKRVEDQSRRQVKSVLIVEDDANLRSNLMLLLEAEAVELVGVGTVTEALRLLDERSFDCMVMDLGLPDGSGYELLERLSKGSRYSFPPVIVYTGRSISRDEEQRLRRYSRSIIIKGARSPDRLVDEVSLFLHQVESNLPADQQRLLRMARSRDAVLDGRRILLAEDDVRNVFALINVLEPLGATVEIARNGREALERLRATDADIDLVLMDIMMPEMDGFAAMREIRGDPRIARVPIIALTANAMPEDRVRCLEAGADDYIAKPIEVERLVSLCRVWMPR